MVWPLKKKPKDESAAVHENDEHCDACNCPEAYLPQEMLSAEQQAVCLTERLPERPEGYSAKTSPRIKIK